MPRSSPTVGQYRPHGVPCRDERGRTLSELVITSASNPRVQFVRKLANRRFREDEGRFVVEGEVEVLRALRGGVVFDWIHVCEGERSVNSEILSYEVPIVLTSRDVLAKITYRSQPTGIVGVAQTWELSLTRLVPPARPLVLVVESIEKPGNLGAMLRTSAAMGADAVIVADAITDVFNPNVVRASVGAIFRVPIAVATTKEVIAWLTSNRIPVYATFPDQGVPPWTLPLGEAAALVVGAEHVGLSSDWLGASTANVAIPMERPGGVDSLNASVAAAMMLFEASRQRSGVRADQA